jgi:DNA-binding NarL/FixJ family response regulator
MTAILIIEDDEDFAVILKRALEQDPDLSVVGVITTEEQAFSRIRSTKLADCNCVLLDLQLPKSDGDRTVNSMAGLRILEELRHRQRYYGTIIVLTNSRAPADGQRALSAGCDGYLCKRARISEIPEMLNELKLAIRGDVILVSRPMRHVFIREDISAKEARLLDLLNEGKGWAEIARELSYKTPKAAANIGDRIFDKLLTPEDQQIVANTGGKKRLAALQIWQSRRPGSQPAN